MNDEFTPWQVANRWKARTEAAEAEVERLRQENERLRATIHNKDVVLVAYRIEVEQLRAALEETERRRAALWKELGLFVRMAKDYGLADSDMVAVHEHTLAVNGGPVAALDGGAKE